MRVSSFLGCLHFWGYLYFLDCLNFLVKETVTHSTIKILHHQHHDVICHDVICHNITYYDVIYHDVICHDVICQEVLCQNFTFHDNIFPDVHDVIFHEVIIHDVKSEVLLDPLCKKNIMQTCLICQFVKKKISSRKIKCQCVTSKHRY